MSDPDPLVLKPQLAFAKGAIAALRCQLAEATRRLGVIEQMAEEVRQNVNDCQTATNPRELAAACAVVRGGCLSIAQLAHLALTPQTNSNPPRSDHDSQIADLH